MQELEGMAQLDAAPTGDPLCTGTMRFPAAGYKAELRRAFRQGIDPAILILDLVIIKPAGPVTGGPERKEVRYEEKTHLRYARVQIRPDDVLVSFVEVG